MTNYNNNSIIQANITGNLDLTNIDVSFNYLIYNNSLLPYPFGLTGDLSNNLYVSLKENIPYQIIIDPPTVNPSWYTSTNDTFYNSSLYYLNNIFYAVNKASSCILAVLEDFISLNLLRIGEGNGSSTTELIDANAFTICNKYIFALTNFQNQDTAGYTPSVSYTHLTLPTNREV